MTIQLSNDRGPKHARRATWEVARLGGLGGHYFETVIVWVACPTCGALVECTQTYGGAAYWTGRCERCGGAVFKGELGRVDPQAEYERLRHAAGDMARPRFVEPPAGKAGETAQRRDAAALPECGDELQVRDGESRFGRETAGDRM